MRNLDTAWLRTLVAVADNGSFAKAAQAVNRSESAVSLQIGNLERETGAKLFRKDGRRMVLTDEGLTLLNYARQALDLHDGVLKQLSQDPDHGTVRIGMPQDFVNTWLPAVLASLAQKYPRVHLQTAAGRSPIWYAASAKGRSISPWSMESQRGPGVFGPGLCPWFGSERRTLP